MNVLVIYNFDSDIWFAPVGNARAAWRNNGKQYSWRTLVNNNMRFADVDEMAWLRTLIAQGVVK